MKRVVITLAGQTPYTITVNDDVGKHLEEIDLSTRFLIIDDVEKHRHFINLEHLQVIIIREATS